MHLFYLAEKYIRVLLQPPVAPLGSTLFNAQIIMNNPTCSPLSHENDVKKFIFKIENLQNNSRGQKDQPA